MPDVPKVIINGFGRIGRLVTRALADQRPRADIVAVNDLASPEILAHLLSYDSVHGPWRGEWRLENGQITLAGDHFQVLQEPDPGKLPVRELGADYVIECTGAFTTQEKLRPILDAGAKRVILSAPGKGVDVTVARGVNMEAYDPDRHRTISNASCTTNCAAPVLKVLNDAFGVEQAFMTTVHAYTNNQPLLDSPSKDLRRARAAALNIVPTSTGASEAIGAVLPELTGKVDGIAVRVPVPNVSLLELTTRLRQSTDLDEVTRAFRSAEEGPMKGILRCEARPLVSSDFIHDPTSAIVDLPGTNMLGENMAHVLAWYDNEWAFSTRIAELVQDLWSRESAT